MCVFYNPSDQIHCNFVSKEKTNGMKKLSATNGINTKCQGFRFTLLLTDVQPQETFLYQCVP